jgi:hypothetical protein
MAETAMSFRKEKFVFMLFQSFFSFYTLSLIKVSVKISKKNLAPLIVAQFSETLTRPLIAIRKISNTRGDYCRYDLRIRFTCEHMFLGH